MRTLFSVAVVLLCSIAPVWAQDATKPADTSAQAVKPGTLALPPSATDTTRFRYDPPSDPASGFSLPHVDLGASTLKFDASRKEPANKVGIEAINPAQLGDIQKQQSTVLPNYLGLTLSKPLN